jgi:hypothetical protein
VRRVQFAGQCVLVPTKRREYRNFSVPLRSTQCETAETFTCRDAGVDDPLGDVGEFRLTVLGYPPQHLKSAHVVDIVSRHDDAFGLTDTVPGQQRGLQLLFLTLGQNRSGVRGDNAPRWSQRRCPRHRSGD